MNNITSFSKPDTILNCPGKFFFQITEDNEIKFSNIPMNKKAVDLIKTNIQLIFKQISDKLKEIRHMDPDYYNSVISKLERFSNINFSFGFPGLQVKSLNTKHADLFSKYPDRLLICEKSDGVRFLLIQFENGKTVFLGRNLEFFIVDLTVNLPKSHSSGKHNEWDIEHFIDGELIIDKLSSEKVPVSGMFKNVVLINNELHEVNFIAFDAVVLSGQNIGHFKFKRRLAELAQFFKKIKYQYLQTDAKSKFMLAFGNQIDNDIQESLFRHSTTQDNRTVKFQIGLYMKDYFTFDKINFLYSNVSKTLNHHNDGVILNLDDYPYYSGSANEIFKWKPASLNTVDFELSVVKPNNSDRELYVLNVNESSNKLLPITCMFFETNEELAAFRREYQELCNLPNRIILECYYDFDFNTDDTVNYNMLDELEIIRKNGKLYLDYYPFNFIKEKKQAGVALNKYYKGAWRFMRFRRDKQKGNHITVFLNIWQTIIENLTLDKISQKIKQK
jgi:hypothetical protein